MFDYVRGMINDAGLGGCIKINCDIPRWYNSDKYYYGGKPLSHLVIDKADIVTIMDYVTSDSNIKDGAKDHIDYAT